MPRWKLLSKIMCYLAMADSGGEQVDCGKSCWEYTQDSTPSKMSKARDEYTNQCKSTHHIRPLALVEVVIGIIQFTIHTHTCTHTHAHKNKVITSKFLSLNFFFPWKLDSKCCKPIQDWFSENHSFLSIHECSIVSN